MNTEKPIGNNAPTPNAPEESNKQSENSKPQIPPTLAKSELQPHYEIACKTEKNWWDKIKPFVECVGIILLAIYTCYTIKMYWANKQAADAATTAAKAAQDSADLQRTIVEGTQTAEVMPQELNLDDRNFLRASVMNVGGVASAKSSVDIEVSRQHLPDKRPLGTAQVFHFTADSLRVRQSSGPHVFEILGYTAKDKWNIYHKRQAIIINTTIEFEDGFGKLVQRKSCNEYLSIYGPKDHPQNPEMAGCESVAMRLEQVLPPEQRAWKWQQ